MDIVMEVAEETELSSGGVIFADDWPGHASGGWVGNGDPHWRQAAVLGVSHALRVARQIGRCVTMVSIDGNYTVTNPTIVSAAAVNAVWQSIGYSPSLTESQQIESKLP
jgi:hypothetical protein